MYGFFLSFFYLSMFIKLMIKQLVISFIITSVVSLYITQGRSLVSSFNTIDKPTNEARHPSCLNIYCFEKLLENQSADNKWSRGKDTCLLRNVCLSGVNSVCNHNPISATASYWYLVGKFTSSILVLLQYSTGLQ